MRGRWEPYALTTGLVLAVVVISLLPKIWAHDHPPLILFVIPILIAVYVAGAAVALGTTILVALATASLILPSSAGQVLDRPIDLVRWLALILTGILISLTSAPHAPSIQAGPVLIDFAKRRSGKSCPDSALFIGSWRVCERAWAAAISSILSFATGRLN